MFVISTSNVLMKCIFILPATLKHVAKTVAHVDLSDHVIQVVYTIFDENSKFTI